MSNLRRQGIYNENLPTKKSKTIEPSDFLIGGLIGFFERRYKKTFQVRTIEELSNIFGQNNISTYYGWDGAQGFFDNAVGVDAKLFVKSHVGNDGSAFDGVAATINLDDQASSPLDTLQLDSAYELELDYSISGNRTGYTIENGDRFVTAIKTAGTAADTFVIVDSVSDVKIGDIIKMQITGGAPVTVHKKVLSIDESTGQINFTDVIHATSNADVDDVVSVIGFQLKTWRQSLSGIVTEVNAELGKVWCTMESEVTDYFVENVFAVSQWIKATDLESASTLNESFPADVSSVAYLASGANGTSPTTIAQWSFDLISFDDDPVRILCNVETTDSGIQKAAETYCKSRNDTPKWIYNLPEDQSKSQLITIGNNFQRSDDVLGILIGNWYEKNDPFSFSTNAPKRKIPSCAHIMGLWVRSAGILGIHWIPAVTATPIYGITGIVGDQFLNDLDRTDLANAGINITQFVSGSGFVLKSFFTGSTTKEFLYGNGIFMREFIKISIKDSLKDSLNEPNSLDRIQSSRTAIVNFLQNLWERGSTGNVPEGETFGQTLDISTGEATKESDHYQVQADLINNPQANIELGERNLDSWFTYPSPAGSIKIGVGLMLLG